MSNSKATKDTGTKKTVEEEKKNVIKWGPDNIQTFLETFQNYELLWNVRHEDYPNKAKREKSVLKLKEDLISQGLVVPDVAFLRARIKTIKTTYRSELLKVLSSKTTGSGADDVYTPKLPWFPTADTFLNSIVVTRDSQSNLAAGSTSPASSTPTILSIAGPARKRKPTPERNTSPSPDHLKPSWYLETEADECLTLAKGYVTKMRKLTPNQLLFADKVINDTLFAAQMGLLTENSYLIHSVPS